MVVSNINRLVFWCNRKPTITLEASPSSSTLTKKRIYKVEPSIARKKRSKNVEVASTLESPSSTKNRSPTKKDKAQNLEPKVEGLEKKPNEESNLN